MHRIKCLIITSSAGGGHLQAAAAQKQHLRAENPNIEVIEKDVLREWVWRPLGNFSIESWNRAQKKGNIRVQKLLGSFHWLFDYITWPNVFFHTLKVLFNEDIDRVIDTQITSTSAIVQAIRIYNWKRSKNLLLEKMIVDLPTKKATHFLRPIKRLSKRNQKVIKLRTIRPLLEQGQTSNEFWQKHCGLCESKITYEDINVRIPFKLLQGSPRLCTEMTLSFNVKNQEEEHLLKEALQLGSVESKVMSKEMEIHIPENGRVVSILLGSQPARVATLNYVKNFIDVARKLSKHSKPLFLFVFCADHIEGSKSSLFRDLIDLLKKQPSIPSFLSVIPFSFQSSKVIAPLFHRSIITCSRSGGVTAMELMAVSTGEIWIHSESRKKNPTLNDLLKGIPKWESENALYLFKLEGARIVTPETFSSRAEEILSQ